MMDNWGGAGLLLVSDGLLIICRVSTTYWWTIGELQACSYLVIDYWGGAGLLLVNGG